MMVLRIVVLRLVLRMVLSIALRMLMRMVLSVEDGGKEGCQGDNLDSVK